MKFEKNVDRIFEKKFVPENFQIENNWEMGTWGSLKQDRL